MSYKRKYVLSRIDLTRIKGRLHSLRSDFSLLDKEMLFSAQYEMKVKEDKQMNFRIIKFERGSFFQCRDHEYFIDLINLFSPNPDERLVAMHVMWGSELLFHDLAYNALLDLMLHDPDELVRAEALLILSNSPNEGFPSNARQRLKYFDALREIHGDTLDGKIACEMRNRLKISEAKND